MRILAGYDVVSMAGRFGMNDEHCSIRHPYVCKWCPLPPVAVPTPAEALYRDDENCLEQDVVGAGLVDSDPTPKFGMRCKNGAFKAVQLGIALP